MPINGSAGCSDNTPLKQQHFSALMRALCPAIRGIIQRHQWAHETALYLDLNAGPGYYHEQDLYGSPLLALEAARAANLPFQAYTFERDALTYKALIETLQVHGRLALDQSDELTTVLRQGALMYTCYAQDYRRALPGLLAEQAKALRQTKKSAMGVIYSDENGTLPPILYLMLAAAKLPRCDMVLHVSAANLKRVLFSEQTVWDYSLDDCLTLLGRDHWIVREPYGRHQWTIIIGSQWEYFPVLSALGFYRREFGRGAEIFRWLNERREDRA